ncbi:cyclin N-terminal domain-containing protein 1 isoform X3 [Cyanistes caeruleus]|uniref:cyclin N-terminal domain-containing protein 1 isoform X3 n=1 Tax=Cyanistes caeruleus TaxID=156563 RepID=UPI000CDA29DC|nr:cyclin N-terminal domain-containing protein 1 isoform X3 [Cyanistes caeruleus]
MGSQVPLEPRGRDSGPVFSGVAPEIIEDTLIHLATENEQYLSELPGQAGCFKETRIVEFIFLLSEKWHLNHSTRYQAVELLERFMIKQVEQMCDDRGNAKGHGQGQKSSWSSVRDQIVNTFVLRLVSCVQLASKLSLHYSRVTSDTALKFLQSLKYSYTKQELLESELAVLNTLHYQINVSTPLAYVELLLEVLGYNGCLLPAKPLHQLCVQLLDFCYLTRETIYDTLLKIAIDNSTPSELQIAKFLTVKEDFMLLAVGVISTGVFILSLRHWDQVVEHLNCITGITSQSILEFSYAVVKRIVGSTTPEQHRGNCGTKSPEDRILPQTQNHPVHPVSGPEQELSHC